MIETYPLLKWVGTAVCFIQFTKFTYFILKTVLTDIRRRFFPGVCWHTLGRWAVITGGTDGIGKAYAEKLASMGFDICLISRNVEKLNAVAEEIDETYGVSTKIINVDFTDDKEIYDIIKEQLNELDDDIGVLVNNVGMSYKFAESFHKVPGGMKGMENLIYSNIASCTMMMKIVLPQMEKKRKGVIINISSLTAIYPMPLLAVYAACKAYVSHLSIATQYEYRDKGIIIQCVLPGYVATKMSNRRTSLEVPSATTFVDSAVRTIGIENYTYGYFSHKIRGFVHEWLKAHMPAKVNMAISMYYMNKSREKYYKKAMNK